MLCVLVLLKLDLEVERLLLPQFGCPIKAIVGCVFSFLFDSYFVIVNSVVFSAAIKMRSVRLIVLVLCTLLLLLVAERREDNSSHVEELLEAELLVKALRCLVFVANDHKRLVAALDDETSEVLCQKDAIAAAAAEVENKLN